MRVSARNHQGQHGKLQFVIAFLSLLQQHGMDVAFNMVDGNQRLVECERQRLGITDTHKQCAREPGPLRHRDSVDRVVAVLGLSQRLPHDRHDRAQMLAGRQFRHHAAIGLVSRELRRHNIRDELLPERTTAAAVSSQELSMPRM